MLNFDIKTLAVVELFGIEIWITETLRNTWILMGLLIIAAIFIRHKFLKSVSDVPSGFQNAIEALVELFDNFVTGITGERYHWLGNWFFGIIIFIAVSNISGLINLRPPTADISTTLAIALVTFILIHVLSFKANPKEYAKGYLEPFTVFLPINIISEFAIPVSLGFRLFGNVIAGTIVLGLIYGLLPNWLTLVWPSLLHGYFDLFSGLLHAFIFTILSLSFIMNKIPEMEN